MKINFRTLFLSLFALAGISKESFAIHAIKTCDDINGIMCWECGTNCTATLYDGGELVIAPTGAGAVTLTSDRLTFFKSSNPSLPQDITSVKINEGITRIGDNSFWGVSTITKVELADSVTSVGADGLNLDTPYHLIISENSSITFFNSGSANNIVSIFCRGNVETCRSKLIAANSKFANKDITDELRDSDDRLLEKCSSSGCDHYEYDEDGKLKYVKDDDGNLLEENRYDGAGNIVASYKNGVATYRKTSYTPAEAAAAVKKGNNNKVTLTFK